MTPCFRLVPLAGLEESQRAELRAGVAPHVLLSGRLPAFPEAGQAPAQVSSAGGNFDRLTGSVSLVNVKLTDGAYDEAMTIARQATCLFSLSHLINVLVLESQRAARDDEIIELLLFQRQPRVLGSRSQVRVRPRASGLRRGVSACSAAGHAALRRRRLHAHLPAVSAGVDRQPQASAHPAPRALL